MADDPAGVGSVASGGAVRHRRHAASTGWSPSSARARDPRTSRRCGWSPPSSWPSSPSASRSPTGMYGTRPVPDDGARRLGADRGGPQGSLRRRLQRGGVHAAGAASSPTGWSRSTTRRWTARSTGWPPWCRRHLDPAAAAADRLRPLLRAVDAGRRGPGRRRDPGGAAVVTSFPWLTVLWVVPLVGAAVVILLPAAQRAAGQVAGAGGLVAVLAVAVVVAVGFDPGGDAVPVRRIPLLDPGVRRRLHPRASTASRWRWCCSPRCWCRC